MKDKYSGLLIEEKIRKLKKGNKILLICVILCTMVIVTISIAFFICELDKFLAIGILWMLPFSLWCEYFIPKKENNKQIKS